MQLTALDVRDVRIIARAALEPTAVNLIIGPNAAGKTSLLEAIHLLGSGRSFSPVRPERLIRTGGGPMRVVARLQQQDGASIRRLGIEKEAGTPWRMRLDGGPVPRIADLARVFPVAAVHPASHELLSGGPAERRALLDWGLFHVEQSFHACWQRYRRALTQRNALLRRDSPRQEIEAWDPELVEWGSLIHRARVQYVERLNEAVRVMAPRLVRGSPVIELRYRAGWLEGEELADMLTARLATDRKMMTTTVGPHRAELSIRLDGQDSRQRVSRGQQKLLIYLLRLCQAQHLTAETGQTPVLLFDDPGAELDADHRARVLELATEIGAQIFVAGVDRGSLPLPERIDASVFHVEQGTVREVVQ